MCIGSDLKGKGVKKGESPTQIFFLGGARNPFWLQCYCTINWEVRPSGDHHSPPLPPSPWPHPLCTCIIIDSWQFFVFFIGEYGGWREALDAGNYRSVFVFAEPAKIPRHNFYEFIWLLKTGAPRVVSCTHGYSQLVKITIFKKSKIKNRKCPWCSLSCHIIFGHKSIHLRSATSYVRINFLWKMLLLLMSCNFWNYRFSGTI
jgi:hypothetical protein